MSDETTTTPEATPEVETPTPATEVATPEAEASQA
jgi:hypothetical protein